MNISDRIKEVDIIMQVGPKVYIRGQHFDYAEERRISREEIEITLYKNNRLVVLIHPRVPVVIEYD